MNVTDQYKFLSDDRDQLFQIPKRPKSKIAIYNTVTFRQPIIDSRGGVISHRKNCIICFSFDLISEMTVASKNVNNARPEI